MPNTFGCRQKASLAPDRRPPPNSSIYENSTKPHADNCRPVASVAWTSVTSLHRSQSAPANQSNDHLESPPRPASGNERNKQAAQTKRYRAGPKCNKPSSSRRWVSSYPINCLLGDLNGSFYKTADGLPCCEGGWVRFDEKPSFQQIYGPSIRFCPSSLNQSNTDIETLMMVNVDVDAVPTNFKDADSRGNRGKPSSVNSALSELYRDGDGSHNVCSNRNYSRERTKQKHRYAESNSDIAHSGDAEKEGHKKHVMKRDLEAKGDELRRKGRSPSKGHSSSSRHSRVKPDCEYMIARDGDHEEAETARMRGCGSYQQNHIKSDMRKSRLEDVLRESPDEQMSHTLSKHTVNSQKVSHDRSASRRVRMRHGHTNRKVYDVEPLKMEPLDEVDDVEAGLNFPPVHNESQDSGGTCLAQNQLNGPQWMATPKEKKDLKNKEQKAKNPDVSYDMPFAELSQEWMRFRKAEESGDWVASEDEVGGLPDTPPMFRFMKFLSAQYTNRSRERCSQSSRSPENPSASKSQVDLTTHQPFDVAKGRGALPQRPLSAFEGSSPERMYGGSSHYPTGSESPPPMYHAPPSSNKVFPSQGKSARGKKDVPLWEHLSPAMQVEHAAVITNQLCRAMAMQAAKQQRSVSRGERGAVAAAGTKHKSPSSESRVSRSTDHPPSAPRGGDPSPRGKEPVRCPSEESEPIVFINAPGSRTGYDSPRGRGRDADLGSRERRHRRDRNRSRVRHYSKGRRSAERLDRVWFDNELAKAPPGVTPLRGGGASVSPCGRPCCPSAGSGMVGADRCQVSMGGGGGRGGRGPCTCTCRDGVPIAVFNFTECAATFQQYMRSGDTCGDDDACECEGG